MRYTTNGSISSLTLTFPSGYFASLHDFDFARFVDFDVGPVLLANHNTAHAHFLGAEIGRRIVDARARKFRPRALSDDDAEIIRVAMIRLGVEEYLPRAAATFRSLDGHFHDNGFVDPSNGFHG